MRPAIYTPTLAFFFLQTIYAVLIIEFIIGVEKVRKDYGSSADIVRTYGRIGRSRCGHDVEVHSWATILFCKCMLAIDRE